MVKKISSSIFRIFVQGGIFFQNKQKEGYLICILSETKIQKLSMQIIYKTLFLFKNTYNFYIIISKNKKKVAKLGFHLCYVI